MSKCQQLLEVVGHIVQEVALQSIHKAKHGITLFRCGHKGSYREEPLLEAEAGNGAI